MDKLEVVAWEAQAEIDRLRGEVERLNACAQEEADTLASRATNAEAISCSWKARAMTAEAEVAAVLAAIPGVRFMDPPDGGDPKPHEQVQRMADALKAAETEVARLTAEREKDREALEVALSSMAREKCTGSHRIAINTISARLEEHNG